jgi:multisubunit Na+/H+ antiporter MnhB subunit
MTWTTIAIIWMLSGLCAAVYNVFDTWYDHEIFEAKPVNIFFDTVIQLLIGLVIGPIGVGIIIYEKFFDSSNI